jgi:hypothetical protein
VSVEESDGEEEGEDPELKAGVSAFLPIISHNGTYYRL